MELSDKVGAVKKLIADITDTEVTIVAAVKTQTIETIRELEIIAPEIIMGENRVDELLNKYNARGRWQFIGQLQTNKVKYLVDKVELIQSLDRVSLLYEIERQALKRGIVIPCLIEVNVASEPTKGGIAPEALDEFISITESCPHVIIEGLMTVAPQNERGEKLKGRFDFMREKYLLLKERIPSARYLSMGMSNDYLTAIECGSNMVRLGRSLFGERNYV